MELTDKTLLLQMLQIPRFNLSPDQLVRIENIIDGAAPSASPVVCNYREAAALLGLTSRNSDKTVALWARQGVLVAVVPPGRKNAIGVTRDSVMRLVQSSKQ